MKKILFGIMVMMLASCGKQDTTTIQGTQDYNGKPFTITVKVYSNYGELNRAISEINNGPKVSGFSVWNLRADTMEMTDCTLHVVKPSGVKDYAQMTTWGHELMHCVYGEYHKLGER